MKDIPGEVGIVLSMIPAKRTVDLLGHTPVGKEGLLAVIASGCREIGESDYKWIG